MRRAMMILMFAGLIVIGVQNIRGSDINDSVDYNEVEITEIFPGIILLTFPANNSVLLSLDEKSEWIDDIGMLNMPTETACNQTFDNIGVWWTYCTDEYPVSYPAHVYIYEDDTIGDDLVEAAHFTLNQVIRCNSYAIYFDDVPIGLFTCNDADPDEGEFYGRVWIESVWSDEDESTGLYVVTDVSLSHFAVFLMRNKIYIIWQTSYEQNNAGWNLYRSADGGAYVKLNDSLIEPYQYDYEYIDADVEAGVKYCYKLEAVDLDGSVQTFGPECVVFGPPDSHGNPADVPDVSADDDALSAAGGCGW